MLVVVVCLLTVSLAFACPYDAIVVPEDRTPGRDMLDAWCAGKPYFTSLGNALSNYEPKRILLFGDGAVYEESKLDFTCPSGKSLTIQGVGHPILRGCQHQFSCANTDIKNVGFEHSKECRHHALFHLPALSEQPRPYHFNILNCTIDGEDALMRY